MSIDIAAFHKALVLRGRNNSTANKYTSVVKLFSRSGQPATGEGMAQWLAGQRDAVSVATLRNRLAALRSYCRLVGIDYGPLEDYQTPPLPPRKPHPLPEGMSAVRELIAWAPSARDKRLVALCALAGLRVSEAVAATTGDLETWNGNRVLRVQGKGEKARVVPVNDELAGLLLMDEPGRFVPLSESRARELLAELAADAGIKGHDDKNVSSHDLRATFATAAYAKTGDLVLVQRWLGHADPATTEIYIGQDHKHTQPINF